MTPETDDHVPDHRLTPVLLLATSILVLVLIWLVIDLRVQVREKMELQDRLDTLKLPVRYIIEEPECSDRLIQAMGIENVRIRSTDVNQSGGSTPP